MKGHVGSALAGLAAGLSSCPTLSLTAQQPMWASASEPGIRAFRTSRARGTKGFVDSSLAAWLPACPALHRSPCLHSDAALQVVRSCSEVSRVKHAEGSILTALTAFPACHGSHIPSCTANFMRSSMQHWQLPRSTGYTACAQHRACDQVTPWQRSRACWSAVLSQCGLEHTLCPERRMQKLLLLYVSCLACLCLCFGAAQLAVCRASETRRRRIKTSTAFCAASEAPSPGPACFAHSLQLAICEHMHTVALAAMLQRITHVPARSAAACTQESSMPARMSCGRAVISSARADYSHACCRHECKLQQRLNYSKSGDWRLTATSVWSAGSEFSGQQGAHMKAHLLRRSCLPDVFDTGSLPHAELFLDIKACMRRQDTAPFRTCTGTIRH